MTIEFELDVATDDTERDEIDVPVAADNEDLFADFKMLTLARRTRDNKPAVVTVDIGVEKAQRGVGRAIVAFSPPKGVRLVWDSPDYGYQLVEVDMRHNGKVYVFGYLDTEIEPRWFYQALTDDAAIMPAPAWAEFPLPVDAEHVDRMRRNTTGGNPDAAWQQERYEDLWFTLKGYR